MIWLLVVLVLAVGHKATAGSAPVGVWSIPPSSLPNAQLPYVPLIGNGHIGVALDAWPGRTGVNGPGNANSLDFWVNSNAMWSCSPSNCTGDSCAPAALCRAVAFGGVTFNLQPTFPQQLPSFEAQQQLAPAQLVGEYRTAAGSTVTVSAILNVTGGASIYNVSYAAAAGDPSTLVFDVVAWVVGASTSGGGPSPTAAGCADATTGAPAPCSANASAAGQVTVVSRLATSADAVASPRVPIVWAALAAGVAASQSSGATVISQNVTSQSGDYWSVATRVALQSGNSVSVVCVHSETVAYGAADDPAPNALTALADALAQPNFVETTTAAWATWWSSYWAVSSVSMSSQPVVEQLWWGSQYILAATATTGVQQTAAGAGANSTAPYVPAPGLYGPWVTSDECNWNGDYTLDYNYETPFYGAFASNHVAQAASYYQPILDWRSAAAQEAQTEATAARVTCPAAALHYSCHLAPWGARSFDGTVYMHWNGAFAALPFINHFEYSLDVDFAAANTYPLLDGLMAWWACFLQKVPDASYPDGYRYDDFNAYNPDQQHEEQPVPNPQIGLSLIQRIAAAQLVIGAAIGADVPAYVQDIHDHLARFNTAPANVDGSTTVVWSAYGNASAAGSDWFSLYPLWPAEYTGMSAPNASTQSLAQASSRLFSDFTNGRPVDLFPAAVLAAALPTFPGAWTPSDVLAGLNSYLGKFFGPNMLPYAPGGGIENIALSRAIAEMLVTSVSTANSAGAPGAGYVIRLLPFWPANETVAFSSLLVKGGFAVSAAYDGASGAVQSPVSITAQYTLGNAPSSPCRLQLPWPGASNATVTCAGVGVASTTTGGIVSFDAPRGVACSVAPAARMRWAWRHPPAVCAR